MKTNIVKHMGSLMNTIGFSPLIEREVLRFLSKIGPKINPIIRSAFGKYKFVLLRMNAITPYDYG